MRPSGMVVSPIVTSRVMVRPSPWTGEVSRRNSSTASGIRSGFSASSRRWSGRWCSSCTEPPSMPVVVSLPPVTIVNVNARIDSTPAMSPSAPTPAATRCETVSSAGLGAPPLDQRGEVGHHLAERVTEAVQRAGDAALGGVGRDDRLGPPVELVAVLLGHAEVVRDDHRRQRLEQFGDDVAAAVGAQPLDALDDELADLRLDRLDLAGREAARDQLAELGVHRRVLHDHRRVVGQADHLQFAVVDGQALRRRERLVVAGGGPDVGVPGQHVVVVIGLVRRARRGAPDRGRAAPGTSAQGSAQVLGGGELEAGGRAVRQSRRSCLMGTTRPHPCQQCTARLTSDGRARVEDVVGVERLLDAPVELHHLGAELAGQPRPLQPADAVLAGDGAAEPDGQIHDLAERRAGRARPSRRRRGRTRSAGGCCRRRRARSPRSSGRAARRSSRRRPPGRPARAAARRRPRAAASPWPRPRGSRSGARRRTPRPRRGRRSRTPPSHRAR